MTNSDTGKASTKIVKATLEAVFATQERLRKHLELLEKENRPLKDEVERDLFFREITYSTLGLGVDRKIEFKVSNEYNGSYIGIRADVETTARWLGDQKNNTVNVPLVLDFKYDREDKGMVPISVLWKVLKENLYTVFPLAIAKATSLSKEQEATGKTKGFKFNRTE